MEKVKNIISIFLKIDPREITENTVIDRSAIPGSVLIHRMYSTLSSEGFRIVNQRAIRTYGDLLNALDAKQPEHASASNIEVEDKASIKGLTTNLSLSSNNIEVGIDIEDIENMPLVNDFREESFYTDNFSKKEISHCILQPNPLASFAGKFAAKEAIIKADNAYQSMPFKQIEILNNAAGKPFFKDFSLSISHTESQAIAIAIRFVLDSGMNLANH